MRLDDAVKVMPKKMALDIWMQRLESVDRAVERSETGWAKDYWHGVRIKLSRQMKLINAEKN